LCRGFSNNKRFHCLHDESLLLFYFCFPLLLPLSAPWPALVLYFLPSKHILTAPPFRADSTPNAATTLLLIFSVTGVLIGATSSFLGLIHGVRRDHALRSTAFGLSFAAVIFYCLSLG
jgi:hypothetical protein